MLFRELWGEKKSETAEQTYSVLPVISSWICRDWRMPSLFWGEERGEQDVTISWSTLLSVTEAENNDIHTWTTTTWMETWSGNLIGALKCCDSATNRCRIATILFAWTANVWERLRNRTKSIKMIIKAQIWNNSLNNKNQQYQCLD